MGKLREMIEKHRYKREGRLQEYNDYKESIDSLHYDINMYEEYLNSAIAKFEAVRQQFPEDSKEYTEAKDEYYRWKSALETRELELKFVRPNLKEDIEYRNEQYENFVKKLQEIISPDLDLRFHGTPLYYAEQIIKSGGISSSADRKDGYIQSTDIKGEISAANVKTLPRTINFFSDMTSYNYSSPAGCIFAMYPKDKEDANYGHDLMHNVDFRKNPEQLFGIFTTPENIERVKGWMNESGFNPDCVYTFEEFLEAVKEKSASIDKKNALRKEIALDNYDGAEKEEQSEKTLVEPINNVNHKEETGEALDDRD